MKKSLGLLTLLILFVVSFGAGARFNQLKSGSVLHSKENRQILHFVDPMNPAHTSNEPGIAPCGMPMEPVYADLYAPSGSGTAGLMSLSSSGALHVSPKKQQIVGVQVDEATKATGTATIRALGRIIPEENRIYPLISASDGWMEDIHDATTGSLVSENQLLAQIKIYNYDFFTWQQRYLTELGYTNRLNMGTTPLSTNNQSRRRNTSGAGYEAGLPIPESQARFIKRGAVIEQMSHAAQQQMAKQSSTTSGATSKNGTAAENETSSTHHGSDTNQAMPQSQSTPLSEIDHTAHMENMANDHGVDAGGMDRDKNLLYSSKGRLELLNLGVEENQITALADNGAYMTHVDIRSPVNGYILARNVSSRQKIERGTECFRVVDLGQVWVEADIYDIERSSIQPGMMARVSLPRQKTSVTAIVSDTPPRFDSVSRSLKVRLTMENPELLFQPNMFVDVEFLIPMPEAITVPTTAVIDSGKRKTVYVAVEEGIFEPREVATGWQTSDRIEIIKGLQPGEKIVTSGNFLLDSESRMKLAAARLMEDTTQQPAPPQVSTEAVMPAHQATKTISDTPMAMAATITTATKDPVCGMRVNQDQAKADGLTFELEGTTYFFCSADCKEQFTQDPQRFLSEKPDHSTYSDAPGHGGHAHD